MMSMTEFNAKVEQLEAKYRAHFDRPIPDRIIGWWDPVHLEDDPMGRVQGVAAMRKDVEKAIQSNIPIEEIPEDEWRNIIF